jgi:KaiC/GvpD/RAD55 family RecA-like ATPase/5S rRNA maturation endonuclease (ribonuclease M5)
MGKVLTRIACPACREQGNDADGDNLAVYADGAYCYACGYRETYEPGASRTEGVKRTVVQNPRPVPLPAVGHGRVSQQAAFSVGERTGEDGTLGYEYTDTDGVLAAYKMRVEDRRWWVGDRSVITWYGFKHAKTQSNNTLVICEGESDCAAAVECGIGGISFVSVPDGCKSDVKRLVQQSVQWLRSFKRIVVMFDTDEPGVEGAKHVAAQLPKRRTYIAKLPEQHKDIASIEGLSYRADTIKAAVSNADAVESADSFAKPKQLIDEAMAILKGIGGGVETSTGYPDLDKYTGGIQSGDLVILLADPGQGKTTLFANLCYQQAKAGRKPLFIPLEMTAAQMAVKFAEVHLGQRLFSDKEVTIPEDKLREALEWVARNIVITDKFGECDLASFREWVETGVDGYDIGSVWFDHITAAVERDWKQTPEYLATMKRIAVENKVAVWTVSHTTTSERDQEGTRRVDLRDTRGGQALSQYADCVLGVRRPEGRGSSVTEIHTLKMHRFVGVYGATYLEWERGQYIPSSYSPSDTEDTDTKQSKKSTPKPSKKVADAKATTQHTTEENKEGSVRLEVGAEGTQPLPGSVEGTAAPEVHSDTQLHTGLDVSTGNTATQPTTAKLPFTVKPKLTSLGGDKRTALF